MKLDGEIPKKLVKFLSLRNRKGVVEGWLSNWRIDFDGRLSAEISGYAPTSRVKHHTVVNVPKADPKILLGCEMRDLFEVDKGYWYCGMMQQPLRIEPYPITHISLMVGSLQECRQRAIPIATLKILKY